MNIELVLGLFGSIIIALLSITVGLLNKVLTMIVTRIECVEKDLKQHLLAEVNNE